jgi:hypothetical protein
MVENAIPFAGELEGTFAEPVEFEPRGTVRLQHTPCSDIVRNKRRGSKGGRTEARLAPGARQRHGPRSINTQARIRRGHL